MSHITSSYFIYHHSCARLQIMQIMQIMQIYSQQSEKRMETAAEVASAAGHWHRRQVWILKDSERPYFFIFSPISPWINLEHHFRIFCPTDTESPSVLFLRLRMLRSPRDIVLPLPRWLMLRDLPAPSPGRKMLNRLNRLNPSAGRTWSFFWRIAVPRSWTSACRIQERGLMILMILMAQSAQSAEFLQFYHFLSFCIIL